MEECFWLITLEKEHGREGNTSEKEFYDGGSSVNTLLLLRLQPMRRDNLVERIERNRPKDMLHGDFLYESNFPTRTRPLVPSPRLISSDSSSTGISVEERAFFDGTLFP